NRWQKELHISQQGLQLQTEIPLRSDANEPQRTLRVRGLSPSWLAEDITRATVKIAPGQSGELSINWREWFDHGYWSSREHEVAAEPALLPPADGQLLVRVCAGGAS